MKPYDIFRVALMVANGKVLLVSNLPLQLDSHVETARVSRAGMMEWRSIGVGISKRDCL
eukprot:COSAG02_NODE_6402_length_3598_cov_12.565019_5_plen_59_part_00